MKKPFFTTYFAIAALVQPLVSHAETVNADPLYHHINALLWEKHPCFPDFSHSQRILII